MGNKILLSADRCCDLGQAFQEKYGIHYVSNRIILEGKEYLDSVDIFPEDLFAIYREKKVLPRTVAINVSDYIQSFKPWVEQGYEIIHLNLGSGISGSHQSCRIAADMLGNIYPVDSYNLSTGIGMLALEAAEMIAAGMDATSIQKALEELRGRIYGSFVLDTLEFMAAGGRCSAVAALGANLLNIKPCIEVENTSGKMHLGKKYRGNLNTVLPKYTQDFLTRFENVDTKRTIITHTGSSEQEVELVKKAVLSVYPFQEIYVTRASCTISSHCGPKTLGMFVKTNP